jgi:hypothetical protein
VQATDITAPLQLRWFIARWGYDLKTAGTNLIGLSNSLNIRGRYLHVDKIEEALRLLSSSTKELLDAVKEEVARG